MSFFFDPNRVYQRAYSLTRQKQADAFIEAAGHRTGSPVSLQPPAMCIGVATVGRPREQYVRSTIGSLLEGLTEGERRSIYLVTFIAHTNPDQHPIYDEKWVETLSNKVPQYTGNSTELARLRYYEDNGLYRNKTIYDYSYLLRECYSSKTRYVAMVEDDTCSL